MPEFSINTEIRPQPHAVVIRPVGYFSDEGGDKFRAIVQGLIEKGEKTFVLNFQGSPIVNSIGISCILDATEVITTEVQGTVVFCGLSKAVNEAFKLVGILSLYRAFDTEDAALASLPK